MSFLKNLGPQGQGAVAGVVAVILGIVGYVVYDGTRPQPADAPADSPVAEAPATPATDQAAPATDQAAATAPAQDPAAAETADTPQPAEQAAAEDAPQLAPSFDVVRVDPTGGALVAGRAEPQANVQVLIDGEEVAAAPADGTGQFVAMFSIAPSTFPRLVTLMMTTSDGAEVPSEAVVILDPTPGAEDAPQGGDVVASAEATTEAPATQGAAEDEQVAALAPEATLPATGSVAKPQATEDVAKETAAVPAEADPATTPQAGAVAGTDTAPATEPTPDQPAEVATASAPEAEAPAPKPEVADAQEGETPPTEQAAAGAPAPATPVAGSAAQGTETVAADTPADTPDAAVPEQDAPQEPVAADTAVTPEAPQTPAQAPSATASAEAPVAGEPAPQTAETPQTQTAEAPDTATAEAPEAATTAPVIAGSDAAPAAPSVILSDASGVRVLQSGARPEALNDVVTVEAIAYRDGGKVVFSGRGQAGSFVRLYLNNNSFATETVDEAGRWTSTRSDINPGIYTLRIDQVDADGKVTSRFETPFKRETEDVLEAANALKARKTATGVAVVTVQPGFTLWAIARENYGEGIEYVKVYEANRSQIRDPDLIYPGQVFEVPDAE